ncbi:MAG TPA: SHOCT domain-containing protein, partial [Pseudonocardiaceae bacterium]
MEGGLLVLTDQRLLLIRDRNQGVDEYPLDKVTSVRWSTGFPWGRLALVVDGRQVEFHQMSKDEGRAIADTIAERVPGGIELVDGQGRIDVAEQLRKLAELRDAGIVTAEEFETKKAELLARM